MVGEGHFSPGGNSLRLGPRNTGSGIAASALCTGGCITVGRVELDTVDIQNCFVNVFGGMPCQIYAVLVPP